MAALTGQEVVSALSKKLRTRFSVAEFAEIYKDTPVQSMKTPCIFIHSIETTHIPDTRNYAWWDHLIDIRCHPGRMCTNIQTWARSLGPMIVDCIQHITVSNRVVKARNITWRVEDNVLHVITSYKYRVVEVDDPAPHMETLAYGQKIKQ